MTLTVQQYATLWRAIRTYATDAQWGMVQEECAELIAAINRAGRGRVDEDAVAEEVADVLITCLQAELLLPVGSVRKAVDMKMERLATRLDEAEARGARKP